MSRHKLTRSDAVDYQGGSVFCQFAQVVCELDGVVPRKELHEAWEAARLIHAAFPSVMRVADLASGNGLLSWALMVMDSSQQRSVLCIDKVQPPSFARIANAMISRWPTMRHRHRYVVADIEHPHLQSQAREHAHTRSPLCLTHRRADAQSISAPTNCTLECVWCDMHGRCCRPVCCSCVSMAAARCLIRCVFVCVCVCARARE